MTVIFTVVKKSKKQPIMLHVPLIWALLIQGAARTKCHEKCGLYSGWYRNRPLQKLICINELCLTSGDGAFGRAMYTNHDTSHGHDTLVLSTTISGNDSAVRKDSASQCHVMSMLWTNNPSLQSWQSFCRPEITSFPLRNLKVHYRIRKNLPLDSLQFNPVSAATQYFPEIQFNIILPSTFRSPTWPLPLKFPHLNLTCILYFLHVCYT